MFIETQKEQFIQEKYDFLIPLVESFNFREWMKGRKHIIINLSVIVYIAFKIYNHFKLTIHKPIPNN